MANLTIGYDLGTQFIKATLFDADTGKVVDSVQVPKQKQDIIVVQKGWAEQDTDMWWSNVVAATKQLQAETQYNADDVKAVGIGYQMHGLVAVDKDQKVVRPSIIWCDDRAIDIGKLATSEIGEQKCLENLFNQVGNFTAAKLRWVKDNEPELYATIKHIMLPGDWLAMRMSGKAQTTKSGLSEGMLWNHQDDCLAQMVMKYFDFDEKLIPEIVPTFGEQATISKGAAGELGLNEGTLISYRHGDQPNNAWALGVNSPGMVGTNAGTSGVTYGISDKAKYDLKSRVNIFRHGNHTASDPRYGVLSCLDGAAILYEWLKDNFIADSRFDYEHMNDLVSKVDPGSDGLLMFPFGNGAERTLEGRDLGWSMEGGSFNTQKAGHHLRASMEGIAYAMKYGIDIMSKECGVDPSQIRACYANLFKSEDFCKIFSAVNGASLELFNTDGAEGAARGAAVGAGLIPMDDSHRGLESKEIYRPDDLGVLPQIYQQIYTQRWLPMLNSKIAMYDQMHKS